MLLFSGDTLHMFHYKQPHQMRHLPKPKLFHL
jgi:hypothetical protein